MWAEPVFLLPLTRRLTHFVMLTMYQKEEEKAAYGKKKYFKGGEQGGYHDRKF